ncbi:N-acetylglutamate synthase [Pseudoalteromonas luteoviolacea B = ATCC 29581]|nr:N-acetylglutamate synthase [Pseudoalteromonas luteoviolacea B = ATCC 29581]
MWKEVGTLLGNNVALEPLQLDHTEALVEAVNDGESWKLWYANVPNPDRMTQYIERALLAKNEVPFVVRDRKNNKLVGTTRFYNIDEENRRAMIGYTWYANIARRTAINSEAKLLLLHYAFEEKNAIAVELRTHFFNFTSRQAIERLGAKLDGILRNHQILADGSLRDTAVYSIIASEWPTVKNNLLAKLDASRSYS